MFNLNFKVFWNFNFDDRTYAVLYREDLYICLIVDTTDGENKVITTYVPESMSYMSKSAIISSLADALY